MGAVAFFDETHQQPKETSVYKKRSYGLDFLTGFLHFILFFAWAITLSLPRGAPDLFPVLLVVVLLYDLVWLAACWSYDTRYRMSLWALINFVTVLLWWAATLGLPQIGAPRVFAEDVGYLVLILVSAIDFAEIITNKPIYSAAFGSLIRIKPPA